jgi:glycosyltransferase involved in cell wall biosynthesis
VPNLKGAYVLFDALRALHARGVRVDVTLIAVTAPLREEIRAAGLEHCVRTLDFLTHEQALAALRRGDAFLQISSSEGFPNLLLEAMALGCAAIVTPVGAVPEVVGADGECAFIVPAGDAAALADRMARLAADRDLLARMAGAAQARVIGRFTAKRVTPVLEQAYRIAIAGHAGARQLARRGVAR